MVTLTVRLTVRYKFCGTSPQLCCKLQDQESGSRQRKIPCGLKPSFRRSLDCKRNPRKECAGNLASIRPNWGPRLINYEKQGGWFDAKWINPPKPPNREKHPPPSSQGSKGNLCISRISLDLIRSSERPSVKIKRFQLLVLWRHFWEAHQWKVRRGNWENVIKSVANLIKLHWHWHL